jgi:serine/threonine-protein phosphatase 2A activator
MYEAEVLGKRVVVQHIPLGGLLEWDLEEVPRHARDARDEPERLGGKNTVPWSEVPGGMRVQEGVKAPWAGAGGGVGSSEGRDLGATSAPWRGSGV